MSESAATDLEAVLGRIQVQAASERLRITQHAQQEMVEEDITLDEVLQAIATGQILEYYPEHRRGACCLLNGITERNRSLHAVCTTAKDEVIIITTYELKPPKWVNPTQRRP
jgi:hypothetical protein